MPDVLSKLRDDQQKKLMDVLFKDVCMLTRITWPALSPYHVREIVQCVASVENVASTHNRLQSLQVLVAHSARPWTARFKISFAYCRLYWCYRFLVVI